VVVIVIKKNTSQCLRLAPFNATSDSSTTSEFWMNSGDEIRGQTATTRSHTRGHESIRLSIFNPEEENARDWITDNERAKKMYGAGTSTRQYTGCRPILLERPWNGSKGGRFRTGNGRILLSNYVVLFEANRLWNKV
jgi:hypothetical protein